MATTLPTAPHGAGSALPTAPAGAEPYGPPPVPPTAPMYPPSPQQAGLLPPSAGTYLPPATSHEPDEPPRRRRWGRTSRSAPRQAGTPERSAWSGHRVVVLLARIAVLGVLAIIAIAGIRAIVYTPDTVTPDQVAATVTDITGQTGFPETAGAHAAELYLDAYLTYPADPQARAAALSALAPDVRIADRNPPAGVTQEVLRGPYLIGAPTFDGTDRATYTFATQVQTNTLIGDSEKKAPAVDTASRWEFMSVPVYADPATDAVTVAGQPTYVPAPPAADLPREVSLGGNDSEFLSSVVPQVLVPFFTDWAASDATRLKLVLDPDATYRARTGLGGAVTFDSIASTFTPEVNPETGNARDRYIETTVNWRTPAGATAAQTYLVNVYRDDAGEWRVWDVETFNPDRSTSPTS